MNTLHRMLPNSDFNALSVDRMSYRVNANVCSYWEFGVGKQTTADIEEQFVCDKRIDTQYNSAAKR